MVDALSLRDYGEDYWAGNSYGVLDPEEHIWWISEPVLPSLMNELLVVVDRRHHIGNRINDSRFVKNWTDTRHHNLSKQMVLAIQHAVKIENRLDTTRYFCHGNCK